MVVSTCFVFTHAMDISPGPVTSGCQGPRRVVSTCCVFVHTLDAPPATLTHS